MTKWIAEPLKGVNGVEFGMTRDEIREKIGEDFKEFKKSRYSKNTTDDFGFCHIYYTIDNLCEAIEIFTEISVELNGEIIFPNEIVSLDEAALGFEFQDDCYISKAYSVGIYAPHNKMESIILAVKDYFD